MEHLSDLPGKGMVFAEYLHGMIYGVTVSAFLYPSYNSSFEYVLSIYFMEFSKRIENVDRVKK